MSEFDDIVAAAGIVIVESGAPGDGGDADSKQSEINGQNTSLGVPGSAGDMPQVAVLEALFLNRYTMEDEGYAQTVNDSEFNSSPPCVPNFREKRSRDYHGGRGGRGGRGDWRQGGRGGGGGWRQDRDRYDYRYDNYNNRQSYRDREDHRNRNWQHQHRDGGDGSRGHHQYQDRYRDRDRSY